MVLQGSCPYCYEAAPMFPPVRILEMVEMADDASGSAPPCHLQGFHRLLLLSCFPRWSTTCHLGRHETGAVVAADGQRPTILTSTLLAFFSFQVELDGELETVSAAFLWFYNTKGADATQCPRVGRPWHKLQGQDVPCCQVMSLDQIMHRVQLVPRKVVGQWEMSTELFRSI